MREKLGLLGCLAALGVLLLCSADDRPASGRDWPCALGR